MVALEKEKYENVSTTFLDENKTHDELPKMRETYETKDSLEEVKSTSAKILANQELIKKYGFYDDVRRQTVGVINSLEIGVMTGPNLTLITENIIIAAPNYWLTFALSALSYWYLDNKEKANKALKKALSLNNTKSALFFTLMCSKEERMDASFKWLKRYLDSIDPRNTNADIVPLIDALCSGALGKTAKDLCLSQTKKWKELLYRDKDLILEVKKLWIDFFKKDVSLGDTAAFPYLKEYASNYLTIEKLIAISKTTDNIFLRLDEIINRETIPNINIEAIITNLITSKEDEERKILQMSSEQNNILYYLTKFLLGTDNISSPETKKFALYILKDLITLAYNELKNDYIKEDIIPIDIKLESFSASSVDASNEEEIHKSYDDYLNNLTLGSVKEIKAITPITIIIPIILIVLAIIFRNNIIIVLLTLLMSGGVILFTIYKADKNKKKQNITNDKFKKEYKSLLNNILAEIVDYSRIFKKSNDKFNDLFNYLNNINIDNLISSDFRNIGGD